MKCVSLIVTRQWRSSAPKSGGHKLFFPKSEKQKKKNKKKSHSGVKAQDRGIVAYNLMHFFIKVFSYVQCVLKLY